MIDHDEPAVYLSACMPTCSSLLAQAKRELELELELEHLNGVLLLLSIFVSRILGLD